MSEHNSGSQSNGPHTTNRDPLYSKTGGKFTLYSFFTRKEGRYAHSRRGNNISLY